MSGTKTARIDLNAAAKAELAKILKDTRAHASVLASLSNLLGQLQSVKKDVEHFLGLPKISHGFRVRMENFRSLIERFSQLFDELRSMLARVKELSQSGNAISARNEATKLEQEIKRVTSELQALATEAKDQLRGVEESMATEAETQKYLSQQADRQLRLELNGLLEELKIRLHPGTPLNFQVVADQANSLLKRIETFCQGEAPLLDSDVRGCKRQFDALVREVEKEEEARQKQWAIFTKLNSAFEKADFYLATPVLMPEHHQPIRAQHAISDEQFRASVNTMIHNESVSMEMWGASGEDSTLLVKDPICPANLDRIIAQALKCGLVIKDVLVKDPNNPTGWSAMVLPSMEFEESESSSPAVNKKTKLKTREQHE
jgi:uncharacterized protein YdcH (DUF465 family)